MFKKHSALLWIVLGILAISARPALANKLDSATATANCQGYTLTAVAGDLQPGKVYTIDYNFTITCSGGSPVNVPGTISFTATAKTQTVTVSGSFPGGGLTGSCVVTGTAALEVGKDKQIAILINGVTQAPLTCSPITANCRGARRADHAGDAERERRRRPSLHIYRHRSADRLEHLVERHDFRNADGEWHLQLHGHNNRLAGQ